MRWPQPAAAGTRRVERPGPWRTRAPAMARRTASRALSQDRSPDHRVAGDEAGELVLAQPVASCRSLGEHEISHLGTRVPDPNLDVVAQRDAHLGQQDARL